MNKSTILDNPYNPPKMGLRSRFGKKMSDLLKSIWKAKTSYAFAAPYMIIFLTFTILPVFISIFLSFTQFNILEPAKFIGLDNYRRLFLTDQIFAIALRNTLLFAVIIGPASYLSCLLLAWLINEFKPVLRAFLTLLFYAPTLANIFFVWQLIFSADSYGLLNAYLTKLGIILEPIQWLSDTNFIVPVVIVIILWGSLGTSFLVFIAGFQTVDKTLYEAGAVDGIKNRWQELWFITLPYMRPQLIISAVLSISSAFGIGPTITALVGFPSTDYIAHTIMHMIDDYGGIRFEMGYAYAIATLLFLMMVGANKLVQSFISKVGE